MERRCPTQKTEGGDPSVQCDQFFCCLFFWSGLSTWRRRQWHPTPVLLPGKSHGWAAVHGVAESCTWLSDFTFTFHFHALEKEMATHSSALAWRILGMVEPGGLPSMGLQRVGYDWSDLAAAVVHDIRITPPPQRLGRDLCTLTYNLCLGIEKRAEYVRGQQEIGEVRWNELEQIKRIYYSCERTH